MPTGSCYCLPQLTRPPKERCVSPQPVNRGHDTGEMASSGTLGLGGHDTGVMASSGTLGLGGHDTQE